MTDKLTTEHRSKLMARVRGKDTAPEMLVRRILHAMGYRFRLHDKSLPGRPDIVFKSRKKVIFVHGCFWHRHPDPDCKKSGMPKSQVEFWEKKFKQNVTRDANNISQLEDNNWKVLVVWQCEMKNLDNLKYILKSFLE